MKFILTYSTFFVIGFGLAVFIVGNIIFARAIRGFRGIKPPSRPSGPIAQLIMVAGALIIGAGFYVGFKGPFKVAGIELQPFPFAYSAPKARQEALEFARRHLDITSRPAAGWRGPSKTSIEYTVYNNGDRPIAYLMLKFRLEGSRRSVEVKLTGPFLPQKRRRSVAEVPPTVSRDYFEARATMPRGHLVGASF